ncbi:MAG: hypothetical protein MJ195_02095 [Mycoplasmoidaceae bacterium]|nr:hypothetical protein [Mycoplasmoidaceae bacterium]
MPKNGQKSIKNALEINCAPEYVDPSGQPCSFIYCDKLFQLIANLQEIKYANITMDNPNQKK